MSYTSGNHIHSVFPCSNIWQGYTNAYGGPAYKSGIPEYLIIDLVTNKTWIDGSNDIPDQGCPNYIRDEHVNEQIQIGIFESQ